MSQNNKKRIGAGVITLMIILLLIVILSGKLIWPEAGSAQKIPAEVQNDAQDPGVYVLLERMDVYSIGWHFESRSGGIINADHSAINIGEYPYLDIDIQDVAGNLERPVPFTLVFSDRDGYPIAQANLVYDPQNPVLIVTLTSDSRILSNGIELEESEIPVSYETILSQYRTAICEGWSGQQLVDAELNYTIRDVESGTVGYAVEDLDGNGIPELAIGTCSGDEFYSNTKYLLH